MARRKPAPALEAVEADLAEDILGDSGPDGRK